MQNRGGKHEAQSLASACTFAPGPSFLERRLPTPSKSSLRTIVTPEPAVRAANAERQLIFVAMGIVMPTGFQRRIAKAKSRSTLETMNWNAFLISGQTLRPIRSRMGPTKARVR